MAVDEAKLCIIESELYHDPTFEPIVQNSHFIFRNELFVNIDKEFCIRCFDEYSQWDLALLYLIYKSEISPQIINYWLDLLIVLAYKFLTTKCYYVVVVGIWE